MTTGNRIEIERVDEMYLSEQDEQRIARMLVRAFGEDFGGRSFHQQRHHLRLLVREQEAVIGHMALCYRSIRLGEKLLPIIGLGEVATDPDFQGQGIASALMSHAIAIAKDSSAAFFLLFGVRPLYAGVGFRNAPNPVTHVELFHAKTGQVSTEVVTDLMIMPLALEDWDDTAPVDLLGHMF